MITVQLVSLKEPPISMSDLGIEGGQFYTYSPLSKTFRVWDFDGKMLPGQYQSVYALLRDHPNAFKA